MGEHKRDKIEELVWYEFVHAKYWEQFLSQYSGQKIDWRKQFNILTIVLSVIGASSWKLWELLSGYEWVTPMIFGLVALTQVFAAVQKEIVIDNDTLSSIYRLRSLYISYSNKLEKLFIEILDKKLSREEIEEQYFVLRETVYPIEELKDSLNIKQLKKADEKSIEESNRYLKIRYGVG